MALSQRSPRPKVKRKLLRVQQLPFFVATGWLPKSINVSADGGDECASCGLSVWAGSALMTTKAGVVLPTDAYQ